MLMEGSKSDLEEVRSDRQAGVVDPDAWGRKSADLDDVVVGGGVPPLLLLVTRDKDGVEDHSALGVEDDEARREDMDVELDRSASEWEGEVGLSVEVPNLE